jgi:hypothetical protein
VWSGAAGDGLRGRGGAPCRCGTWGGAGGDVPGRRQLSASVTTLVFTVAINV